MSEAEMRRNLNASGRDGLVDFLAARLSEKYPRGAWDGPAFREASGYELRKLAEHFADHPDYRQEWRP